MKPRCEIFECLILLIVSFEYKNNCVKSHNYYNIIRFDN